LAWLSAVRIHFTANHVGTFIKTYTSALSRTNYNQPTFLGEDEERSLGSRPERTIMEMAL